MSACKGMGIGVFNYIMMDVEKSYVNAKDNVSSHDNMLVEASCFK